MLKISMFAFSDELEKIANRPPDAVLNAAKMVLDTKGLEVGKLFGAKLPPNVSLPDVIENAKAHLVEAGGHDAMAMAPKSPNMQILGKVLDDARKAHLDPKSSPAMKAYTLGAVSAANKQIGDYVSANKFRTAATIGGLLAGSLLVNEAVKRYRERKKLEEKRI